MIDVRLLRNDPDGTRAALARRGKPELLEQLDQATSLDSLTRDIQMQRDAIRAEINDLSKKVGQARRDGDAEVADRLQMRSRALGDHERVLGVEADQAAAALRDLLLRIPNLPHPDAPDGADEHDNPVVKGP
ncbi:MAG TPA: serine--tRNA ligase, partial [Ilumatobacteraceae bacterium]|nr:serine--tRNA ligase [Ilumatobacteraceae bacterium]